MRRKMRVFASWLLVVIMLFTPCGTAWADEGELPAVPAPTGLKWSDEVPGGVEWELVDEAQGEYQLTLYRDNVEYRSSNLRNWFRGNFEAYQWIRDSGEYRFSLQSLGDYTNNIDSDEVFSDETYVYVRPNKSLDVTTGLRWTDVPGVVSWDPVAGASYYGVSLYEGEDDHKRHIVTHYPRSGSANTVDFSDRMDEAFPYYFTITAFSTDIQQIAHGEESDFSSPFATPALIDDVLAELRAFSPASASDAVEYIARAMDKERLAIAMQSSPEVLDQITMFEDIHKSAKNIELLINSEVFDKDAVSTWGTYLNVNTTNQQLPGTPNLVSLNFAKADADEGLINAAKYGNALAVDISFAVNNQNLQELHAPIVIKVPVPSGIKPSRLVIVHIKESGSKQEIMPKITYENGQAYAAFTVKDFSTFVFAELLEQSVNPPGGNNTGVVSTKQSKNTKSATPQTLDGTNYNWRSNDKGWWLENAAGSYPASVWVLKDGIYYWFNADGYMVVGWSLIHGKWYYLHDNGKMLSNTWKLYRDQWYFFNQDGSMKTGWQLWKDKWYYMDNSGEMLINTVTPDGFTVGADGVWIQ